MQLDRSHTVLLALSLCQCFYGIGWGRPVIAVPFRASQSQSISPTDPIPAGVMPTASTWPQFLDSVRQIVMAYTNALPDFTCTQHVLRRAKFGATGHWESVDQIVAEVSYYEKGETYKVLTIDKKPPPPDSDHKVAGFSSEGDFGNALFLLFAPESNATFWMEGPDRTRGRKTVRARFYVPQNSSRYQFVLGDQKLTTAYNGHCWIDLATRHVIRYECVAQDIPSSSPVRKSSRTTEYALTEIAGNQYWLPARTTVILQLVNKPNRPQMDFYMSIYGRPSGIIFLAVDAVNAIEYKNYRKFGTEVRLVTE